MHLFTLLVATVFSSQFTALTPNDTPFTINLIKVNTNSSSKVKVVQSSGTAWAGAVKINVSLSDSAPASDDATGAWKAATGTAATGYETTDPINFATLVNTGGPIAEGATVYVYVLHTPVGGATVVAESATIDVTDKWWMEHDPIYVDTKVITNVIIHGPKVWWTFAADKKVTLHFDKTNSVSVIGSLKSAQQSAASDTNTWTIPTIAVDQVAAWAAGDLFGYISYVKTADPELDETKVKTEIEAAEAQYDVTPVTLPLNQVPYITSVTITPKQGFSLGATIDVKIDKPAVRAMSNDAPVLVSGVALDDGVYKATFTAAAFAAIQTATASSEYIVSVKTAATGAGYLSLTDSLNLAAGPTFEVADPEIELKELVADFEFTVKDKAGRSNDEADIILSLNGAGGAFHATNDVRKPLANYVAAGSTVKLTGPEAAKFSTGPAPFPIFIYKEAKNAASATGPPAILKVVPNAPAFTHNLTVNGITEAQLKADIPILLTPKSGDTWEADKYVVTITNKNVMPVKSGTDPVPFTFALTQINATNTWETKLDLKAMKPWEIETGKLYAWSAKDGVYITESVPITFTPATATTFTTPETNIVHAATGLKVPEMLITITAGGQTWNTQKTAEKLWYKIVVKPVSASNAPVPLIEGKVTGNVTGFYIPEIPIDTFELPKPAADKPHTLIITISEDNKVSYLASEGIVTVSDVAPVPLTFTIAPATMEFATTLKSPVITITPSDATKMPPQGTGFVAKFTKGTGETAKVVSQAVAVAAGPPKVFTIPEKELADLDIKEADLPVTLKVSLWNGDAELGTAKDFKVTKVGGEEAAMGVSPLLSLLAAALLLLVKLF